MSVLLLFFKERKWLVWLLVALLVVGLATSVYYIIYNKGVQSQVKKDEKQSRKDVEAAQALTLAAQKRANEAELKYVIEHENLRQFIAANPIESVAELCNDSPVIIKGVPTASKNDQRKIDTSTATAVVQQVHAADSERPTDRRRLLEAIAGMADEQSAMRREDQANEDTK